MCSAKTIAGFYRRATEARNFSEDTDNPLKKRDFKEVERKWLSLVATVGVTARNLRSDVLTLLVVSRDDGNVVIFSSASLFYAPRLHLSTGSPPPRHGSSRAQAHAAGRTGPMATTIHSDACL